MKYLRLIILLIVVIITAGCADNNPNSYGTPAPQIIYQSGNIGAVGTYESDANPMDYIILQSDYTAYYHDRTGVTSRGIYHIDGNRLVIDYSHNSAIFTISGDKLILSSSLGQTIFIKQK